MRNYLKIFTLFCLVSFVFAGCKDDVFRIDLTKSSKAEVKRSMEMNTSITISMPDKDGEMKENTVKTENKLDIVAESVEKLKDPSTPGVFISSEKLTSSVYTITQKHKGKAEKSVKMEYNDGNIKVLEKNIPEKEPEGQPSFVDVSKQTFQRMAPSSNVEAEITISDRGDVLNVSADMATEMGLAQVMQTYSGANGIIFPEKAVKVGDKWTEKKNATSFAGFKVTGNPIDFEINFIREKDESLNGKNVAVFFVEYQIDKKGIDGFYGGFPATVDIKDSKKIRIYFDNKRKTFVKRIMDSETLIMSGPPKSIDPQRPMKIAVNVENKFHSVTIEKGN